MAQKVLIDIADEEKVHAGEFLRLLHELEPTEKDFYREGAEEVEEEFLGGAASAGDEDILATPSGSGQGLGIGSLKK